MHVGYIQFRHRRGAAVVDEPSKERKMGAVHVEVRLANAFDEARVRAGELAPAQVRSVVAKALVDTGAVRSVIPKAIYDQLGLTELDRIEAVYADGRSEEVIVSSEIRFHLMGRVTSEEAAVLGDEVLIGQTVLEKLDLLVDCASQRLIHNPKHPNGPAFRI